MQKIQDLITQELAGQQRHLFLWVPVCLAIGIGLYFTLKTEPSALLGPSITLFFLGLLFTLKKGQDINQFRKVAYIFVIGFFLTALGFSVAKIRTDLVYMPMLVKKMSPVGVIGTIDSIEPLSDKDGSRVVLKNLDIERLNLEQTPRKIRLKIRQDQSLRAGQRIKLLAGLNPASPPVAPDAFDFQRMAYFDGLGAVGFAYNAPEILNQSTKGTGLNNLRRLITEKISATTQEPQKSILIALTTGQRGAIQDKDWEALRESGLAHLSAISGLHVGMVAGVLFFFSRFFMACSSNLALKYPIKKWAALIALIGAALYTVMVGATIPTQRALMMTGLVMVAIMCDRSPFSLRLVALAAFIVLLFSPESLTSVSFQMSFAAVTALICFYQWIRPQWVALHRRANWLKRALLYFIGVSLTTVVAGTATGLFALFHFQQYALYGVLANMVAVPLMAFIVMPIAVLSYVLMAVGLEGMSLPVAEWGVGWILATAHWVASLEGAVIRVSAWPQWIFIIMVLCLWVLCVWQGALRRYVVALFLVMAVLAYAYQQPTMLISSRVNLISLQNHDGKLWLSNGRKEKYAAENWLRMNGQHKSEKNFWPKEGAIKNFPLSCDSYGCRGEVSGKKIAVAYSDRAWREDCAWADLVISKLPIKNNVCRAPYTIDYFDIWREGAHAVWLKDKEIRIKTVEKMRGKRPWTQISANNRD